MPRILLGLAVLWLAAPALHAQFSVSAHLGLDRTGFAPDELGAFTTSYNTYYRQRLVEPFAEPAANVTRPVVGATVRYMDGLYAAFAYQYGRSTETYTADLGSGLAQRFDLHVFDHLVHVELGAELGGGLYVGGLVTGLFRGQSITFETVYPDGSASLGNEVAPNGYFVSTPTDIGVGFTAGFVVGPVAIPVRVTFPIGMFKNYQVEVTDYDLQLYSYFPKDWPGFLGDAVGVQGDDYALQDNDFVAPHFSVGLELRLLPW